MVGFAILSYLGWVVLKPKPLIWMNYLIGGLLFGVGIVLAGGCVSGCLFKGGAGNLNSLAAIPGIALGVAAVEHGPVKPFFQHVKQTYLVEAAEGGSVTLSSVSGLPYGLLAIVLAVATLVAGVVVQRRKGRANDTGSREPWSLRRALTARHWPPWQAGLAIGILASFGYLSSAATGRNYPLGVTHGVLHAQLLLTEANLGHVHQKAPAPSVQPPQTAAQPAPPQKKVSWWLMVEIVSLMIGAWVAGRMSGATKLLPKPPDEVLIAFAGGILLGAGAAFARGCVIGNILSGWMLMSVGSILFSIVVIPVNWLTTYVYLMGGLAGKREAA
jgi:hypothetical protein